MVRNQVVLVPPPPSLQCFVRLGEVVVGGYAMAGTGMTTRVRRSRTPVPTLRGFCDGAKKVLLHSRNPILKRRRTSRLGSDKTRYVLSSRGEQWCVSVSVMSVIEKERDRDRDR